MFAVLVEGRLGQSNSITVSDTKIVFPIDNSTKVNEICVFMTGIQALPDEFGAVIWYGSPPFTNWKYLGHITNSKPSAFFNVTNARDIAAAIFDSNGLFGTFDNMGGIVAQIGVEILELKLIEHQFGIIDNPEYNPHKQVAIAQKIADNLFNYLQSFAVEVQNNQTGGTESIVQISVLEKWYNTFLQKISNNPNFLTNLGLG
jgi:hypothetical protein